MHEICLPKLQLNKKVTYINLTPAFMHVLCVHVFSSTSLCLSLRVNCPKARSFKVGQGYVFSTGYFQNHFLDECTYFCNNGGPKLIPTWSG